MDVEGVELDALIGAKGTLTRDKPLCILALHHQVKSKGDSLEQICDVVTSYDYNISLNGKQINKDFFCQQQDLFDVWLRPL